MKKFLAIASPLVALLLVPAFALAAAYNDVSVSPGVFSVNGITINVTQATLSTVVVDTTTFSVTLGPGSSISVSAPNLNQLSIGTGGSAFLTANRCDSGGSSFTLSASSNQATTTVVVTPSTTLCSSGSSGGSSSGSGSGSSGGGGGGGGGGGSVVTSPATTPAPAPAPAPAPSPSPAAGVPSSQLLALVAQLRSLINLLESLGGTVSPQTKALLAAFPAPGGTFARDLRVGSTGADVQALQVYLNTHGFVIATTGSGSPGNETTLFGKATSKALMKFQKAVGITPPNGKLGPKTRAYINAHP